MNKKSSGVSNWLYLLLTIGGAFVVGVIIVIASIVWLKGYTHHGTEVSVPDVTGMYVEEAEVLGHSAGVNIVVIDSTYSKKAPLGAILEQNPEAGAQAKPGRSVYVVINAKSVRMLQLPDVVDMSLRQAEAMLRAMGFNLSETKFVPSQSREVMEVLLGDKPVEAGTKLKEGETLTLVAGYGTGDAMVRVPDLTGRTVSSARGTLMNEHLVLSYIDYLEELTETNESEFVVYHQQPAAGEEVQEGSAIVVKVTTNIDRVVRSASSSDEEDFF